MQKKPLGKAGIWRWGGRRRLKPRHFQQADYTMVAALCNVHKYLRNRLQRKRGNEKNESVNFRPLILNMYYFSGSIMFHIGLCASINLYRPLSFPVVSDVLIERAFIVALKSLANASTFSKTTNWESVAL